MRLNYISKAIRIRSKIHTDSIANEVIITLLGKFRLDNQRSLDLRHLRTRMSTSTRFNLKFLRVF